MNDSLVKSEDEERVHGVLMSKDLKFLKKTIGKKYSLFNVGYNK